MQPHQRSHQRPRIAVCATLPQNVRYTGLQIQSSPLCHFASELWTVICSYLGSFHQLGKLGMLCRSLYHYTKHQAAPWRDIGLRQGLLVPWGDPTLRAELLKRKRIFESMTVCFTGFKSCDHAAAITQSELAALVEAGGGRVSGELDGVVTHLVAASVNTAKARALNRSNGGRRSVARNPSTLKAELVTKQWIIKTWLEADRFQYGQAAKFRPGPLLGCIVSVTGFCLTFRAMLEKRVEALGGVYSYALTPRCTHLVAESWSSAKAQYAMRSPSIKMVNKQWITDVSTNAYMPDEQFYCVANVEPSWP